MAQLKWQEFSSCYKQCIITQVLQSPLPYLMDCVQHTMLQKSFICSIPSTHKILQYWSLIEKWIFIIFWLNFFPHFSSIGFCDINRNINAEKCLELLFINFSSKRYFVYQAFFFLLVSISVKAKVICKAWGSCTKKKGRGQLSMDLL